MKQRNLAWLTLLALPVLQETDMDVLMAFFSTITNEANINVLRALSRLFWYLEKMAAFLTDTLISENIWQTVLDALLDQMANTLPTIFNSLLFGGSGPGLLYLALMLAGLLLTLPLLSQQRLVSPSRVIVWAVVILALFVSSASGYDLLAFLESGRQWASQTIIDTTSDTQGLGDLVAQPMQAVPADMETWEFVLPLAFADTFYPEPGPEDIETREFEIWDFPLMGRWAYELEIEVESSREARLTLAQEGIAMAALTLVPGWVLLLFGLTFAALAGAALVLILFFLAALPLTLFDFGEQLIAGIARQYAYIVALTLLATILPALLVGAGSIILSSTPTIPDMIAYLPILAVVAIAAQYVSQMALNALTGTMGLLTASIRTSVGSYAVNGDLPAAGHVPGSQLSGGVMKAGALVALAASGGTGALLLGADALTGGKGSAAVAKGVGAGAGKLVQGGQHVFAYAKERVTAAAPADVPVGDTPLVEAVPAAMTPTGWALWQDAQAPRRLAQTLLHQPLSLAGDSAAILSLSDRARQMKLDEASLTAVFEAVRDGERETDRFGADGSQPVKQRLIERGLGLNHGEREVQELARLATLVARTVQLPPTPPTSELTLPRHLARQVLHTPEELTTVNPVTVHRLHTLAQEMKLNDASVQHLFEAVRDGAKAGLTEGKLTRHVQTQVENSPLAVNQKQAHLEQLSRLAVQVTAPTFTAAMKQEVKQGK